MFFRLVGQVPYRVKQDLDLAHRAVLQELQGHQPTDCLNESTECLNDLGLLLELFGSDLGVEYVEKLHEKPFLLGGVKDKPVAGLE